MLVVHGLIDYKQLTYRHNGPWTLSIVDTPGEDRFTNEMVIISTSILHPSIHPLKIRIALLSL